MSCGLCLVLMSWVVMVSEQESVGRRGPLKCRRALKRRWHSDSGGLGGQGLVRRCCVVERDRVIRWAPGGEGALGDILDCSGIYSKVPT